jgi:hypothetical protein
MVLLKAFGKIGLRDCVLKKSWVFHARFDILLEMRLRSVSKPSINGKFPLNESDKNLFSELDKGE